MTCCLERPGQLERSLSAELRHDTCGPLAVTDRQHLLDRERLEVEPVRHVVVGGDGLGVAIDHHCLVAELAERLGRVDAAVVELDPLPDPVRPGTEDDHGTGSRAMSLDPVARHGFVGLAPGRVEVVRVGLDLAGA